MLCMGREWGKTRSWSDRSPTAYASFVPCSKRLRVGRYCRGVVAWAVPLGEAWAEGRRIGRLELVRGAPVWDVWAMRELRAPTSVAPVAERRGYIASPET